MKEKKESRIRRQARKKRVGQGSAKEKEKKRRRRGVPWFRRKKKVKLCQWYLVKYLVIRVYGG